MDELPGHLEKLMPAIYNAAFRDGALIALVLSLWGSYSFFRGSITGSPPLYSRGWFERGLHFAAGIIFGSLAIGIALKIVRNVHQQTIDVKAISLTGNLSIPSRGGSDQL
jgi:hypothetical protein